MVGAHSPWHAPAPTVASTRLYTSRRAISLSVMDLLRLLVSPRKLLGAFTIALTGLAALWAFGEYDGRLPAATLLLVPIVVFSVLAWRKRSALAGWGYLVVAWAFGFVAYGALYPPG